MLGEQVEFTFARSNTSEADERGKSRIDYFICNKHLLPFFKKSGVLRQSGLPNHSPCFVEFDLANVSSSIQVVRPHPKWHFPHRPTTEQEWNDREVLLHPILCSACPSLIQAAEACDVEGLWSVACQTVTRCLNAVSGQALPATRGKLPSFKTAPLVKPTQQSKLAASVMPLFKKLHEIKKKAARWTPTVPQSWLSELHATVRNATRIAVRIGIPISLDPSNPDALASSCSVACSAVHNFVDDQERKFKHEAVDEWKHKLKESDRGSKGRVFRWLRSERVGSPKFFIKEDRTIVTDPNDMLEMISSFMEEVYNRHKGRDFDAMESSFYQKYRSIVDDLYCNVNLPPILCEDLFQLLQKKSASKASGLDGWQVKDLHQLPPKAWMPFCLVMKVAEATGKWPQAIKMVAVSSISKGEAMSSPSKVRCIGIASVVYALWSSLRFKQLAQWQSTVCPSTLIGGLTQRSADESEWVLSMDLHSDASDTLAIFLDRFKCFDMVIPQVALGVARRMGMPEQVYRAALGFYSSQVKLFKLGNAFGRRVLSSNSAVQGCSLSILMVNTVYSVFASHVQDIAPSVAFRSFIDDAKMWTSEACQDELATALAAAESFDNEIGQVANPTKSSVLTRQKAKGKRFLKQVGQRFQVKKSIKSLGFSQSSTCKGGVARQNLRASSACDSLRKIKMLPVSRWRKGLYVHTVAHSKWVYGSEVQAPSRRAMHNLRSSVVAVLFKKNRVRCPFLALATHPDPFIDPFGKWVLHCFSKLRRFAKTHVALAVDVLHKAKLLLAKGPVKQSSNGVASVFAFLCQELKVSILDPANFVIDSATRGSFTLTAGSNQYFREFLECHVRRALLKQAANRQDCHVEESVSGIEPFLTRFLCDSDFRTHSDFEFLQPFLQRLPQDRCHTKAILEALVSGAVYTGPRLKAAGLCHTESCPCGASREDHEHLFQHCPLYEQTRPVRGTEHSLTWSTGIFLISPELEDVRRDEHSLTHFPSTDNRVSVDGAVFVDGSAYHERWRALRVSAAAVIAQGVFLKACVLPGSDHSSQRAELYAAVWALKLTHGPITIVSDCASVVDRALALKSTGYRSQDIAFFDHFDLWQEFLSEVNGQRVREVCFLKVKAHVVSSYAGQPEWMTEGNAQADKLAKATAAEAFTDLLQLVKPLLLRAVDVQTHLVATLVSRKEKRYMLSDPAFDDCIKPFKDLRISTSCCCAPTARIRNKTSLMCRRTCSSHLEGCSAVLGSVERPFQNAVRCGNVAQSLADRIWKTHPSFKSSLEHVGVFSAPLLPHDCEGIRLRGCLVSSALGNAMSDFICDGRWKWGSKRTTERVSWVVLCADFTAKYGLFSGFFHRSMSLGVVIRRFRDLFLSVIARHRVSVDVISGMRHAKSLGFGQLGGVSASRQCSSPLHIMSWCLSLSRQLHTLESKVRTKPFASVTPSWEELYVSPADQN